MIPLAAHASNNASGRFIISGGPGAGKTTLIGALAARGLPCFEEVSRQIIEEQPRRGGQLYPWIDLRAFADECLARMRRQLAEARAHALCFFDRGIPDVIGYLRRGGIEPDAELEALARGYSPLVFLAPPWREILPDDPAHAAAHAESVAIHDALYHAYVRCGFTVCELPRTTVADRVEFVLRHVALHAGREALPQAPGGAGEGVHLLVRHTRLAVPPGLCFGRWEAPLAATFAEDAARVRARLPWAPDEVWTSPARRCRALAEALGAPQVRVEARLQEMHFGAWEGRPWEEFHGPESEAWALDPWRLRPPGGETAAELWDRVGAVRAEILARRGARVVLVTHGGVIRAWRGHATGRPFAEWMSTPVDYGGIEVAG